MSTKYFHIENIYKERVVMHPVEWLRDEYCRRRQKNPSYSLRAYAKFLGIPSGRLSEIMSKKRSIGPKVGQRIADKLMLDSNETQKFLNAVNISKKGIRANQRGSHTPQNFEVVPDDQFKLIADWYHYAILSLIKTVDFESSNKWIAGRLGISTIEVQTALERLQRLGFIKWEGHQWVRSTPPLQTTSDIPSGAIRLSHKQSLQRSIQSLEEVEVSLRDITSITMTCDPNDLPKIKSLIKNFRRDIYAFAEKGQKREVYELNIQFVPLTRQ